MYLLDANVLIQAKNLHYGFDFCPAFWEWILLKNGEGLVYSVDKVADEIAVGADELNAWSKTYGDRLYRRTDGRTMSHLGSVSNWVVEQGYEPTAVSTFFQAADYYLIAHALSDSCTVVSHETPSNSRKMIKIPNVCVGLGLEFMTPYEMLRRERARFVL